MVDGVRRLTDDEAQEQQRGEQPTDHGQRTDSIHGGGMISARRSSINYGDGLDALRVQPTAHTVRNRSRTPRALRSSMRRAAPAATSRPRAESRKSTWMLLHVPPSAWKVTGRWDARNPEAIEATAKPRPPVAPNTA